MSSLPHVRNFRELLVYQKARATAKAIFQITKSFPKEEIYSLTSQIRRSSRSVGAQISEAWAKRRYEKHFVSKLTDADAEQQETQHWVETALDCDYIDPQQADRLNAMLEEIGRMLNGMMAKAVMFCGGFSESVSEEPAEYFTCSDH